VAKKHARQQTTTTYTPKKIRALEQRLERITARLAAARVAMESDKIKDLWVFNDPSCRLGVKNLNAFSMQLEASLDAAERGEPYTAKTTKADLNEAYEE
tara:strand:- start:102 stop:398 length:297 start_codon:yes stop_codon:yes gene_type:complete